MKIIREVEKTIAELEPKQAFILRYWIHKFKAAHRYKHLKGYVMAGRALADFQKCNGNALWN